MRNCYLCFMTLSTGALLLLFAQTATSALVCGGDSTEVRWAPSLPDEGAVIQLIVDPATDSSGQRGAITIHGIIADQPLHFEADGSGCYRALAPVPVGSPDTLVLGLSIERSGGNVEQISTHIPVGRVRTGILELNVDPRFISPPAAELPRIRRERELVVTVSRASHNTPRLWTRSFLRPRSSRITANFGQRRRFNGETRSLHLGVDLAGATGTPVIASNRGVVVIVHDFYYAGNAIHIDHGNGLTTAYMHLSETTVAVGDTVARGKVIGRVGATGRVTGPHLHWHTKYGLLTVNPLTLLEVDAVTEAADRGPRPRQ
jgi:murein DD-endopeptidase MepM/ murein hydrolase activator NlpD